MKEMLPLMQKKSTDSFCKKRRTDPSGYPLCRRSFTQNSAVAELQSRVRDGRALSRGATIPNADFSHSPA